MNKHTLKLLSLLTLEVALIALHKFLSEPISSTPTDIAFEWHFIAALGLGIAIVIYAFSIRCSNQNCRERQVFRGWSIFDLRWPEERCYKCGYHME